MQMRKSKIRSSNSTRKSKRQDTAAVSKSLGLKNRSPKIRTGLRKKESGQQPKGQKGQPSASQVGAGEDGTHS
jgi:hypothetical protein